MSRSEACIFDVFGTLVDWRTSVAREANDVFSRHGIDCSGLDFATFWRSRYDPAMERVRAGDRGYVPLDTIHRENLEETLAHFGLEDAFSEDEKTQLNTAWEKLDPWPDVVAGLSAVKAHVIIAPCSNGSIGLMTRLARYGGLPWDCILGAELAKNYKPHPSVYHASCGALRLEPAQVMMVAAHNNDLHAARAAGLQTAFIARPTEHGPDQDIDLAADSDWDRILNDISDLAG